MNKKMFRCLPTGVRLYETHEINENLVTFVNVKTTYRIDEEIIVDYILQNEFKSSTRDWIGIFRRDWLNLQQYLTFEYTLPPPPNSMNPLKRTIVFPRIFHREARLNLEYQFVYVSKEIQIMAMSTCFRFTPSQCNESVQRYSCISKTYPTIETFSSTNVNNNELTMREEKSISSEIPARIVLPQSLTQNCQYCHRPIGGSKIDPMRGNFLAAFSDSLLNRVHRLERDVSFAENALKNAKGARENLAKRLRAYEAFVAEMLGSLAIRGIVKITDEKGKEIVLQRVNENERLADVDTKKINALQEEIVALKSLLEKQQQTIVELAEKRKFNVRQRERIKFVDREVQTDLDSLLESGALDLTVTNVIKDSRIENLEEKLTSGNIAEAKVEKEFVVDSKTETTEIHGTLKNFSKEPQQAKTIANAVPRVLKIPNPSGILVQGKNVNFAIVRFS